MSKKYIYQPKPFIQPIQNFIKVVLENKQATENTFIVIDSSIVLSPSNSSVLLEKYINDYIDIQQTYSPISPFTFKAKMYNKEYGILEANMKLRITKDVSILSIEILNHRVIYSDLEGQEIIENYNSNSIILKNNTFIKAGYKFLGWTTKKSQSESDINNIYLEGDTYEFSDSDETIVYFYPQWVENDRLVINSSYNDISCFSTYFTTAENGNNKKTIQFLGGYISYNYDDKSDVVDFQNAYVIDRQTYEINDNIEEIKNASLIYKKYIVKQESPLSGKYIRPNYRIQNYDITNQYIDPCHEPIWETNTSTNSNSSTYSLESRTLSTDEWNYLLNKRHKIDNLPSWCTIYVWKRTSKGAETRYSYNYKFEIFSSYGKIINGDTITEKILGIWLKTDENLIAPLSTDELNNQRAIIKNEQTCEAQYLSEIPDVLYSFHEYSYKSYNKQDFDGKSLFEQKITLYSCSISQDSSIKIKKDKKNQDIKFISYPQYNVKYYRCNIFLDKDCEIQSLDKYCVITNSISGIFNSAIMSFTMANLSIFMNYVRKIFEIGSGLIPELTLALSNWINGTTVIPLFATRYVTGHLIGAASGSYVSYEGFGSMFGWLTKDGKILSGEIWESGTQIVSHFGRGLSHTMYGTTSDIWGLLTVEGKQMLQGMFETKQFKTYLINFIFGNSAENPAEINAIFEAAGVKTAAAELLKSQIYGIITFAVIVIIITIIFIIIQLAYAGVFAEKKLVLLLPDSWDENVEVFVREYNKNLPSGKTPIDKVTIFDSLDRTYYGINYDSLQYLEYYLQCGAVILWNSGLYQWTTSIGLPPTPSDGTTKTQMAFASAYPSYFNKETISDYNHVMYITNEDAEYSPGAVAKSIKKTYHQGFLGLTGVENTAYPTYPVININQLKGFTLSYIAKSKACENNVDGYNFNYESGIIYTNNGNFYENKVKSKIYNTDHFDIYGSIDLGYNTEICQNAFKNTNIFQITIPRIVSYIDNFAFGVDDTFEGDLDLNVICFGPPKWISPQAFFGREGHVTVYVYEKYLTKYQQSQWADCEVTFEIMTEEMSLLNEDTTTIYEEQYKGLNNTLITIPDSILDIKQFAFAETNELTIRCYAEMPPEFDVSQLAAENAFEGATNIHLHVPIGCLELYTNAIGWKTILNLLGSDIIEMDKKEKDENPDLQYNAAIEEETEETVIKEQQYYGITNSTIIISESIETIKSQAFASMENVDIFCLMNIPPQFDSVTTQNDAFEGSSSIRLYVPVGTLDLYSQTAGWQTILELPNSNIIEVSNEEPVSDPTIIKEYQYTGCSNTIIIISNTVEIIQGYAFSEMNNVNIYCSKETPPLFESSEAADNAFLNSFMIRLYVPIGMRDIYIETEGWNNILNLPDSEILEMSNENNSI